VGNAAPAPYEPFLGSAPACHEPWYDAFLRDLAINGGITLAAAAAGVHRTTVYRHMDSNPIFAEEVEAAKAYYRDLLEWESVNLARNKHNPLPYFARLKAELPTRYIERSAVLSANVNLNAPPITREAARELLKQCLANLSPLTRRLLLQSPEGLPLLEDPEYRSLILGEPPPAAQP
jgi:hypothetical protein